jgi:hypothetical protein
MYIMYSQNTIPQNWRSVVDLRLVSPKRSFLDLASRPTAIAPSRYVCDMDGYILFNIQDTKFYEI